MANSTLEILCFGDSLTCGYYDWGLGKHPYSLAMKARLGAALPHVLVNVYTSGAPGDVASLPGFLARLRAECSKRRYDWVILLGGTNDLAYCKEPEQIFHHLRASWQYALQQSKVLALTVPETEARPAWLVEDRARLNSLILEHREAGFHTFDMHASLPYHALSLSERETYWDDGLHLKPDGYDCMGRLVADALLEVLDVRPASTQQQQQQQRHDNGRDEAAEFEEEKDHPGILSRGYVVVRKTDLD